jgi:hypothetical protein
MKTFFSFASAIFFSFAANAIGLEQFSPHFSTNTPIIWAATNHLPAGFWIYQRLPPRPFPALIISNAAVMASMQSKGFPRPSTNDFYISEDKGPNYPCGVPVIFSIVPKSARISYWLPHPVADGSNIPPNDTLIRRAWAASALMGVDPAQISLGRITSDFDKDENFDGQPAKLIGRGVFLARQLDGISFSDLGDNELSGGFWMEFGRNGVIRGYSLVWPELKRESYQPTASPPQITACIRAFKTLLPPLPEQTNYFKWLNTFCNATKVTVMKITPLYSEGIYGEMPDDNNEPAKIISPFAKLEAVVSFGSSNLTIQLLSPIVSSEAIKLLKKPNEQLHGK